MSPRKRVVAIVPSAGSGTRLGLKTKKPFVSLGGRPLVTYALKALNGCDAIDAIVVAAERISVKHFETIVKRFKFRKVMGIVAGGSSRFQSVKNCLKAVGPSFDIVLIHDGARPFVEKQIIERSIKLASRYGACVVAVPENDTVKLATRSLFVAKTLERSRIYRAQTPQVFRREIIEKAYRDCGIAAATDDAKLVEILGGRVKILKGSYRNIKITTREDLKSAEALL